jgi:hypothetical protein
MFGNSLIRAFRHAIPRVQCDSEEREMSLIEQVSMRSVFEDIEYACSCDIVVRPKNLNFDL